MIRKPLFLLFPTMLAACSGGGSDAPTPVLDFEDSGALQLVHGVDGTTFEDLRGKTVRLFGVYGNDVRGLSKALAEVGALTFHDDGSGAISRTFPFTSALTLQPTDVPGEYRFTKTYPGPLENTRVWEGTIYEEGDFFVLQLENLRSGFDYEIEYAAFGFETPPDSRPDSATYVGIGRLLLSDTQSSFLNLPGTSAVSADFTNGAMTGTLLSVDAAGYELNGDNTFDDRFLLTATLADGRITDDGIVGRVEMQAASIFGGTSEEVDLQASVEQSGAMGTFYGAEAGGLAIIYRGDVLFDDPTFGELEYTFSGLSTGSRE